MANGSFRLLPMPAFDAEQNTNPERATVTSENGVGGVEGGVDRCAKGYRSTTQGIGAIRGA